MKPSTEELFPAAPVAALIRQRAQANAQTVHQAITDLAVESGMSVRNLQRMVYKLQPLRASTADKIARSLGRHPASIWREW